MTREFVPAPAPQNSAVRWVGCSLPEPWVADSGWHPVDATVFTERTRRKMQHMVANAQAAHHFDVKLPITVRASSDFLDVQPPIQTGLFMKDDYLEARFFTRLKAIANPPVIKFEFLSGDVNVPFGELHAVLSTDTVKSQTPTCAVLACPEDERTVGSQIEDALYMAGTELTSFDAADRIIVVVSTASIPFLVAMERNLAPFTARITLAYTSSAALRQVPGYLAVLPSRFYSNSLDRLAEQVQQLGDAVDANSDLLHQCLEVLQANHRAICEAAGNLCPTQLQVWPAQRPRGFSRLDPRNWALHKFKMHLLCEGCANYEGGRPAHFMFDEHLGYDISVPKKWFQRWGKFILISIKILCVTAKLVANGTVGLGSLIPADFDIEIVNEALPLLDIAVSELTDDTTVGELVQSKAGGVLEDLDAALENDLSIADNENTEITMTWLESFLESATPVQPKNAGLRRVFHSVGKPDAGKAAWVCAHCAAIMEGRAPQKVVHVCRSTML